MCVSEPHYITNSRFWSKRGVAGQRSKGKDVFTRDEQSWVQYRARNIMLVCEHFLSDQIESKKLKQRRRKEFKAV